MQTPTYASNPDLVMTYREWLDYRFDPYDIILNASAMDHSDFHQQHPIGVSVFLVEGLPQNPDDFHPVSAHFTRGVVGNAIFRVGTTNKKGRLRHRVKRELRGKSCIFQDIREGNERLPPQSTISWMLDTPFTISPRGFGVDCHRNYEAILFKSIPLIMGADETLQEKYAQLPVRFLDSYADLNRTKLQLWYEEMLPQTFDFNMMSRTYWRLRRPDVDIDRQSRYWLHQFEKMDHVRRYFSPPDVARSH